MRVQVWVVLSNSTKSFGRYQKKKMPSNKMVKPVAETPKRNLFKQEIIVLNGNLNGMQNQQKSLKLQNKTILKQKLLLV